MNKELGQDQSVEVPKSNTVENPAVALPIREQAQEAIADIEADPNINADLKKARSHLNDLSNKLGKPFRVLALAFSMWLASHAGEAEASEDKTVLVDKKVQPGKKLEVANLEQNDEQIAYLDRAVKAADFVRKNIKEIEKDANDQGFVDTYGKGFVDGLKEGMKLLPSNLDKADALGALNNIHESKNREKAVEIMVRFAGSEAGFYNNSDSKDLTANN